MGDNETLDLDPSRCVLVIQDMQNDVMVEGGAFAESGAPEHAQEQGVVENIKRLADACRQGGISVIHVHYNVEEAAEGVEPQDGDFVVEKMRMSAWEGTRFESLLKGLGRDTVIVTGAWTNMSVEHTARTGADKGYFMVVPEDGCSTMNADWHNASINFALQNVSTVTTYDEVIDAIGAGARA